MQTAQLEEPGPRRHIMAKPAGSPFSDMETLHCDKLIIAAGMTSKPVMTKIRIFAFVGQVLHPKEHDKRHKWLTSDVVKKMTVIGGKQIIHQSCQTMLVGGKKSDLTD